jgi:hypothetical protein
MSLASSVIKSPGCYGGGFPLIPAPQSPSISDGKTIIRDLFLLSHIGKSFKDAEKSEPSIHGDFHIFFIADFEYNFKVAD